MWFPNWCCHNLSDQCDICKYLFCKRLLCVHPLISEKLSDWAITSYLVLICLTQCQIWRDHWKASFCCCCRNQEEAVCWMWWQNSVVIFKEEDVAKFWVDSIYSAVCILYSHDSSVYSMLHRECNKMSDLPLIIVLFKLGGSRPLPSWFC